MGGENRTGKPGGWAFEFENAWYPDVDDTAVVAMALAAVDPPDRPRVQAALARAAQWVETMQCKTGGWGAFDIDNDQGWLNRIPYGDLKAMIDLSTADASARVLEMVTRGKIAFDRGRFEDGLTYRSKSRNSTARGSAAGRELRLRYERRAGRARTARVDRRIDHAVVRGAVWLRSVQNADGGWGETTDSYKNPELRGIGRSTASQTAWALIGLLETIGRLPSLTAEFLPGIDAAFIYLLRTQRQDGNWDEPEFTGSGFPVHFYLNYHQYRLHFPLSALGRYAAWRRK